ncbi:MAG: hypothetical protein IH571_01400, partial [Acholeplasmataceae bacterium]|nr:hypothetical protein [Acholeplasmataceae bacterium]
MNETEGLYVFMMKEEDQDYIIAAGKGSESFNGVSFSSRNISCVKATLNHENAKVLRSLFPFTAPVPVLGEKRSFGVGDRLGIAGPGHIRVFKSFDAYPVLAQQSIRELNQTNRTYEEV